MPPDLHPMQMRPLAALPLILFFMLLPIGMFTGAFAQLTIALCGSPADPGSRSDNWCVRGCLGWDPPPPLLPTLLCCWYSRLCCFSRRCCCCCCANPHCRRMSTVQLGPPPPRPPACLPQVLLRRPVGHVHAQHHHLAGTLAGAVHLPHVGACVCVCMCLWGRGAAGAVVAGDAVGRSHPGLGLPALLCPINSLPKSPSHTHHHPMHRAGYSCP